MGPMDGPQGQPSQTEPGGRPASEPGASRPDPQTERRIQLSEDGMQMVTQEDILRFVAERTREDHSISCKDLVWEFDLSDRSACDHLKRLWRDRLVEAVTFRPQRFHFCLRPGESIRNLRFRLASRGKERLRWYREREDQKKREGWF